MLRILMHPAQHTYDAVGMSRRQVPIFTHFLFFLKNQNYRNVVTILFGMHSNKYKHA